MGYGILIGIIITLIYDRILMPIIDLKLEHYKYKITTKCTKEKLDADQIALEFVRKYPESKEENEKSNCNAIGFHMSSEESEFEDEDDE